MDACCPNRLTESNAGRRLYMASRTSPRNRIRTGKKNVLPIGPRPVISVNLVLFRTTFLFSCSSCCAGCVPCFPIQNCRVPLITHSTSPSLPLKRNQMGRSDSAFFPSLAQLPPLHQPPLGGLPARAIHKRRGQRSITGTGSFEYVGFKVARVVKSNGEKC